MLIIYYFFLEVLLCRSSLFIRRSAEKQPKDRAVDVASTEHAQFVLI
jgi:hypothetical protein